MNPPLDVRVSDGSKYLTPSTEPTARHSRGSCACKKTNATNVKNCQVDMWQCFVDWCMVSGVCTPDQMTNNCGSQVSFMTWCRKFWNRQFTAKTTTTRKTKSYSFPSGKKRTYRKAA